MPLSIREKPESGKTFARALPGIVAIFDLLIVTFAALTLYWSRGQFIERAEMATHNLAQVLEQSIQATVKQIDLVLLTIKDEAENPGRATRAQRIEGSIRVQLPRIQILDALRITDSLGTVRYGRSPQRDWEDQVSLADREYFLQLKQFPEQGMVISRPLISRISGKQILVFARRLDGPDGGFAGIVYGTLPLDRLAQAISSVDVGERGSVSLRGADLELLARYPRLPGQDRLIGDRKIDGDYLEAVRSGRIMSHFTTQSRLDGQARTYTLRKISSPAFFILVGLAQAEYLQAWRQEVRYAALAVIALVALSMAMTWMARAAWRRQAKVRAYIEAQGVERENLIQDLQRALAEVKNLEGMLPICGHCKKIRDDQGYWNHLESYLSAHSDATFTHGVCPDCAETMRQEMRDRRTRERKDQEELG